MTDYTELVDALRYCVRGVCKNCSYFDKCKENGTAMDQLHNDAAAAIEALQAEVEELKAKKMKLAENSLRFVGKVRELDKRRLKPKRGKIVRCGECAHCYAEGFVHERNICEKHPELGNVPDDWFCADGEREVLE